MLYPLKLNAAFKDYLWGGTRLRDEFNKQTDIDPVAESWELSCHHDGQSIISNGEFSGKTLAQYIETVGKQVIGTKAPKDKDFPILIKFIDAKQSLSVQVHPNDEYAGLHENSLGKTECWYVLDCKEDTKMVMGHHAKTKEELVKAIENDDYDQLLNKFDIKKGDFFYIPSGTIHAICKGSLIYEAQQSSDITYRVYDDHRKDKDGNERQLHVKQSIDVTTVPYKPYDLAKQVEETIENGTRKELVSSNYLTLNKYDMTGYNKVKNDKPFQLVSIIEGQGTVEGKEVKKGDHFVVCSDQKEVDFDGTMTVMICTL